MISLKDIEKFESKIEKQENGCWIWNGKRETTGYGFFYLKSKKVGTHRLSYLIYKGEIPEGMLVCHTCDVRSCVNPEHLWVGSCKDNIRDAAKKNRLIGNKGRIFGEESRKKMSNSAKGKKRSKETRLKMSLAKKGNTVNVGRKYTEEEKLKMSIARQNVSKETRLKMSIARQNISKETREKLSIAAKNSWEKRKQLKLEKNKCP